jgi:disulfide bond formation protein DsbB
MVFAMTGKYKTYTVFRKNILHLALSQAIVATLGSLALSEVYGFVPCKLCWFQRIFMYPLVIILTMGIVEKNKNTYKYVLPFSVIGMGIALYHNLLYYGVSGESSYYCTTAVSCTTKYIEWFGFITIPLLSFIAFSVITALMLIQRKIYRHKKS